MRTPGNCKVAKWGERHGEGRAKTWQDDSGKIICEGYQRGYYDDEPCEKCKYCKYCEDYEDE